METSGLSPIAIRWFRVILRTAAVYNLTDTIIELSPYGYAWGLALRSVGLFYVTYHWLAICFLALPLLVLVEVAFGLYARTRSDWITWAPRFNKGTWLDAGLVFVWMLVFLIGSLRSTAFVG